MLEFPILGLLLAGVGRPFWGAERGDVQKSGTAAKTTPLAVCGLFHWLRWRTLLLH